jgi:hypothetical protein
VQDKDIPNYRVVIGPDHLPTLHNLLAYRVIIGFYVLHNTMYRVACFTYLLYTDAKGIELISTRTTSRHLTIAGVQKMSPEEKLILYTVLQDIADELRRLRDDSEKEKLKEDQKHPSKPKPQSKTRIYGVSQR